MSKVANSPSSGGERDAEHNLYRSKQSGSGGKSTQKKRKTITSPEDSGVVEADVLDSTYQKDLLFLGAAAANSDELETSLSLASDIGDLLASLGKACKQFEVAEQPTRIYLRAIREASTQLEEVLLSCVDEGGKGLLDLLLKEKSAEVVSDRKLLMELLYRQSPGQLWETAAQDVWVIREAVQNVQSAP